MVNEGMAAWLISKLAAWLSSTFGGLAISMFWIPEVIKSKGSIVALGIVMMVAGGAGVIFSSIALVALGIDPLNLDNIAVAGVLIGMSAIAVVGAIAAFFAKSEGKDIFTVAKDVKDGVIGVQDDK